MQQGEMPRKKDVWPVVFPTEKLIVKRPSLRHICKGDKDLSELLGYFLYEAGRDAAKQGFDPLTVNRVIIYRTLDDILYSIDYSMSKKTLIRVINGLEDLDFLKASPYHHEYGVLLEKVRQAIAFYAQSNAARSPSRKISLPESIIYDEQICETDDVSDIVNVQSDIVNVQSDIVNVQSDIVNVQSDIVNMQFKIVDMEPDIVKLQSDIVTLQYQPPSTTIFDITTEPSPQADSSPHESTPRYNRYNKEIKRDRNRDSEADAIATPPSLVLVSQSSFSSSQEKYEHSVRQREMAPHEQKEDDGQVAMEKEVTKALEKPVAGTPPTVEAFLALADHYRGYRLAHSEKQNSPHRLALEAATTFVNRKKTLAEVDAVFAYMKGVDERFCDDWWPLKTVDIWHVMRHFDSMARQMAHRRAYAPGRHEGPQSIQAGQGFAMYQTAEVMEMPLEQRKLYLARQREQMQQQENAH